jgi:polyphenol oxidase
MHSAHASNGWCTEVAESRVAVPFSQQLGITAFTTTRHAGSFLLTSVSDLDDAAARWKAMMADLFGSSTGRLAYAHQVHGVDVITHQGGWSGWLRCSSGDGHFSRVAATAMAVTLADCIPVFIAHPSGAAAVLHSGWKGTERAITAQGIRRFAEQGFAAQELSVHAGPGICGACYEVSPDVYGRLTGVAVERPTPVDLRQLIASQARLAGVRDVTVSDFCTRCHNSEFFSHRAGDEGRQVGVIMTPGEADRA